MICLVETSCSEDHTTRVPAVTAAGLVYMLAGSGDFAVFALTNEARGREQKELYFASARESDLMQAGTSVRLQNGS